MWVQSAIEKYNRRTHINAVAVKTSESVWTNADGDVFNYTVNVGDVRNLDSVLQPKSYTLAVADIPYGFNAPGSEFDEIAFSEQDVLDMVTSFARVTTAPIWRFAIIHSLAQSTGVMAALRKVCNAGIEAGIWEKTNVNGLLSGNRMAWGFENWTIGYWSHDGVRRKEMYNFQSDESRVNIIKAACVTRKSLSELGYIVNPYQKPVALGDWFVNHFSDEGDWVADLCCGTGSTLVAALLRKQNGSAVDKGESQTQFVSRRIMTLKSTFSLHEEATESGDGIQGQEVQQPLSGEQIGTLSTLAMEVTYEDEDEQEDEDAPSPPAAPTTVAPGDDEMNAMLGD